MKTKITLAAVLFLMMFNVITVFSQAPLKDWDVRFGGDLEEKAYAVLQTTDGGYIFGGYSESGISGDRTAPSYGEDDYWVIKTDAQGVKQWDVAFGGAEADYLWDLEQTFDGGYILGGYSHSGASGTKTQESNGGIDYWMVKIDANGVKQWDAAFGGEKVDFCRSIHQTADGGYVLGGQSDSPASGDKTQDAYQKSKDYWIVKTDANGIKQWDARFGGTKDEFMRIVEQTADGGYILGGKSESGIGGDRTEASQGLNDYWVVKTDANGVKQWDKRYGGDNNEGIYSLKELAGGGYVFGGTSRSGATGDRTQESQGHADFWLIRADANGGKIWDYRYGGEDRDYCIDLEVTSDGGYVLTGRSFSNIFGDKTCVSQGSSDFWTVKTDANGIKEWDMGFGGTGDDYPYSISQSADGSFIAAGYSKSGQSGDISQPSQGEADYWIIKQTVGTTSCEIPTAFTTTEITASSAKASWATVSGAEKYKVRYKVAKTEGWTIKSTVSNSLVIGNLMPGTKYVWQAKTICGGNPVLDSDWSENNSFTTNPFKLSGDDAAAFEVYPNPFTSSAIISFSSANEGQARIELCDLAGRNLQTVMDGAISAGNQEFNLDRNQLAAGVYYLKLTMDNELMMVKKLVIE